METETMPKPFVQMANKGTLREFSKGFASITTTVLRSREHQWPFIILTDAGGKDTSIFLSKKLAEKFDGIEVISTRELGKYPVVETVNAEGQPRLKLASLIGNIAKTEDFDWGEI